MLEIDLLRVVGTTSTTWNINDPSHVKVLVDPALWVQCSAAVESSSLAWDTMSKPIADLLDPLKIATERTNRGWCPIRKHLHGSIEHVDTAAEVSAPDKEVHELVSSIRDTPDGGDRQPENCFERTRRNQELAQHGGLELIDTFREGLSNHVFSNHPSAHTATSSAQAKSARGPRHAP